MRRFSWKKLGDMPLVPFLDTSYEDAVSKVTDALKEEGFGVLTVPWVPHLAVESHHYKSSHRCATVGGHLCSRTWLRRIGWVVTVGVMGLAFGLVYMWRQSLVAPIVMHFLQDFIGIVLLPWLRKG